MSMPLPLPKKFYERAKELKVNKITLHFTGGSDEGFLDVDLISHENVDIKDFLNDIEEWAWEVYSYSGAGDDTEYGDAYEYDIINGTMSHEEWYYVQERNNDNYELELAKAE